MCTIHRKRNTVRKQTYRHTHPIIWEEAPPLRLPLPLLLLPDPHLICLTSFSLTQNPPRRMRGQAPLYAFSFPVLKYLYMHWTYTIIKWQSIINLFIHAFVCLLGVMCSYYVSLFIFIFIPALLPIRHFCFFLSPFLFSTSYFLIINSSIFLLLSTKFSHLSSYSIPFCHSFGIMFIREENGLLYNKLL